MKKVIMIRVGLWAKLALLALAVFLGAVVVDASSEKEAVTVWTGTADTAKAGEPSWWVRLFNEVQMPFWQNALADGWRIFADEGGGFDVLAAVLGFNAASPYEQMGQGMSVWREFDENLVLAESEAVSVEHEDIFLDTEAMVDDWHFELSNLSEVSLSDDTAVLLYHTHNAETYKPTDGVSKREGENAGVSTAAEVLKASLEQKYGLKTLHCKVLHDYPNWNRSYINSLASVKELLAANPKVQAVFDVHRDAGFTSKEPTTVEINGKKAARIMIVVGANHENWQSNLAFAQALEDKSNALYPNLVRSIRIVEANRYNQQAHPQALILEIGSDLNTQEEANYAMECFAQVIAEVLLAQ